MHPLMGRATHPPKPTPPGRPADSPGVKAQRPEIVPAISRLDRGRLCGRVGVRRRAIRHPQATPHRQSGGRAAGPGRSAWSRGPGERSVPGRLHAMASMELPAFLHPACPGHKRQSGFCLVKGKILPQTAHLPIAKGMRGSQCAGMHDMQADRKPPGMITTSQPAPTWTSQ